MNHDGLVYCIHRQKHLLEGIKDGPVGKEISDQTKGLSSEPQHPHKNLDHKNHPRTERKREQDP